MSSKWDKYFHSHYNPQEKNWGMKDLTYYRNWYFSWINYICSIPEVKRKLINGATGFEIGSAIGGTTSLFAEKGIQMTGSDISREIVKQAGKINKNIPFVFCDIQKGVPGNKKFDFIFAFEVLEHLPDPLKSLAQMKKGLKKGGLVIASSPYPFKKAYSDPTHCSVMYPNEWRETFEKAGFSKITTRPMSFLPFVWKLSKFLNPVLPFYIPFDNIVSTTLVIAEK